MLEELEKLGREKGVVSQSVNDVVQSLVDDDLVSKDTIGTSVYYWDLPSREVIQLSNVHWKLESDLESSEKRRAELAVKCDELRKDRGVEWELALADLKALEMKHKALKEETVQYADSATIEEMEKASEEFRAAANRWTENILTLKEWCLKDYPRCKKRLETLCQKVGITEDLGFITTNPTT